jgi:hypothetical protein
MTEPEENRYRVDVRREPAGWRAVVLDPEGTEVLTRACGTEEEARSFASAVRQHIGWLSPDRFREYYRLP